MHPAILARWIFWVPEYLPRDAVVPILKEALVTLMPTFIDKDGQLGNQYSGLVVMHAVLGMISSTKEGDNILLLT